MLKLAGNPGLAAQAFAPGFDLAKGFPNPRQPLDDINTTCQGARRPGCAGRTIGYVFQDFNHRSSPGNRSSEHACGTAAPAACHPARYQPVGRPGSGPRTCSRVPRPPADVAHIAVSRVTSIMTSAMASTTADRNLFMAARGYRFPSGARLLAGGEHHAPMCPRPGEADHATSRVRRDADREPGRIGLDHQAAADHQPDVTWRHHGAIAAGEESQIPWLDLIGGDLRPPQPLLL